MHTQLKDTNCPRLTAVSQIAAEILSPTGFSITSNSSENADMRVILEGLFTHFFSAERQRHHHDDIKWFLELSNEQNDWEPTLCGEAAGVLAGSLDEDLVLKMEQSIMVAASEVRDFDHVIALNCHVITMWLCYSNILCDHDGSYCQVTLL